MGLKRDVIILIYYMSNVLTFEILNIILQNFQGYFKTLVRYDFYENRLIIAREIYEKHALLVSCGLN